MARTIQIIFAAVAIVAILAISAGAFAREVAPLRAGDVLAIQLPGEEAFNDPFQIDRDGDVILPEVGNIPVAGLSVPAAKELIIAALGEIYRDVGRVSITLVDRRLSVSVLGYVEKPGPVDLPANATVQMAVNAAGGLSEGAQLNRLQVRRGDETITFDYKAYLDNGDPSLIPGLQPLDTIFVPASPLTGNVQVNFDAQTLTAAGDAANDGSSIKVFGEVHRPGLFAYKDDADVVDMIMRAGGVTRFAGVEQIRLISQGEPIPFNLREYLDTGDTSMMPPLKRGDMIFIPQATEQVQKGSRTVYVMGEVKKPGAFETKENATFFDILANSGGPTRFAETRQIRIIKLDGHVEKFDLHAYTEGLSETGMPIVEPGDAVLVPEKTDMNEKSWLKVTTDNAIRIIGAVNRPGRYEWAPEMSVMDIIAHAGGPRPQADTANVQILLGDTEGQHKPVTFDLEKYLKEGGSLDDLPRVAAGDTIVVPELPQDPNDNRSQWIRLTKERAIYVFGEVGAPGRFAFNENLTFLDILSAANGPTKNADLRNIRISHRGERNARVTKLNLSLYFETGDESLLPKVKPEDVIFIPEVGRQWLDKPKEETVRVLGSVAKPGRYRFDDTMTILDLLAEAGGPTREAYQERIVVVNRSVSEPQASSFDLVAFARGGDFNDLPVLRAGDTVYVPNLSESPGAIFRTAVRDIISLITIASLGL